MERERATTSRLAAYAAMAGGVIPAAAAGGAIVSQSGLNLVAEAGSPVSLQIGPANGAALVFSVETFFDVDSADFDTASGGYFRSFQLESTQTQIVRFQPGGPGGWTSVQFAGYSAMGADRLPGGALVDATSPTWFGPIAATFGNAPRLAYRYVYSYTLSYAYGYRTTSGDFSTTDSSFTSTAYGSSWYAWAPDRRGFLGLRLSNGSGDWFYAWVDVEADMDEQELIIHGWGLEKTPNAGIEAGALPSPGAVGLGLLAMGAAGIRRQRLAG